MRTKSLCVALACTASVFSISTQALAQEQAASPTADGQKTQSVGLEDIVVTAQRRAENVQKVPISITTLSSETLKAAGVASSEALVQVTPGLTFTQQLKGSTPYIRGVGTQATNVGLESPVAVYVDGVYLASPTGLIFQFNNVERVEVIKGPQGTLFGRNATGGLVNVITRTPSADPSVEGSIGYGNYDTVDASLYATGGNDKIKADIAFKYTKQFDGFGKNLTTGDDVNRINTWGLRSKIMWTPTDGDTFTVGLDYTKDRTDLGVARNVIPGSILSGGVKLKGTIYDTQAGASPEVNHNTYGASLKYEHDFGDMTLTSLTAYRQQHLFTFFDQDGTPLRVFDVTLIEKIRTLQQEILLVGKTGRLDYTAGVFFLDASAKYAPSIIGSSTIPSQNYQRLADQETQSYAGFLQGTYEVLDGTKLTAGLRYTVDQRNFSGEHLATAGNTAAPGTILLTAYGSRTYPKLTWRLAVDQQLNSNILAYVSYNRGFKSGSFNSAAITQAPVRPEVLDAYETGIKSELFDRLVRLNVAAFHYNYKDIQLTRLEGPTGILFNAARGRINGAEAEIEFAPRLPFGELRLNGGVSYLDAKYLSFPNGPVSVPLAAGGNATIPAELAGNRMVRTPKFTGSLAGSYAIPIGGSELEFNASYYHNGGFYWEPDNRLKQNAYDLVNGQIAFHLGSDRAYTLRVYGKNLTNKEYFSYATAGSLGDQAAAAPPRTYGAAFDFKF